MRDDRLDLNPLDPGERSVRVFKARHQSQCGLCRGWIQRTQRVTITSSLRTCHLGCYIDARNLLMGQPTLPLWTGKKVT